MAEQRFRKACQGVSTDADGGEPTRTATASAGEPTRTEAASTGSDASDATVFQDPILCELLRAQTAWLATRDPAALRRRLIAVLAALD